MAKTICWIQRIKKSRDRKKWQQRWKGVVQINEQCCYGRTMENLRNRIDIGLEKDCLE